MKDDKIKLPEVVIHTSGDSEIRYSFKYKDLNRTDNFKMTTLEISCSTIQMSKIDNFYGNFEFTLIHFTKDLNESKLSQEKITIERNKFRQLVIQKLRAAMSEIVDEKIVLFSTVVGEDLQRDSFFEDVSDFVAVGDTINPNTDNTIRIWGFITDAEYHDDLDEEYDDYDN
jgi:hypothetical protein